jgi:hypothetical protein
MLAGSPDGGSKVVFVVPADLSPTPVRRAKALGIDYERLAEVAARGA